MKELLKRIYSDKITLCATIVLVVLYLAILFADFLAVYPENFSDRTLSYAPPSNIYVIDMEGKLSRPYTYNYVKKFDSKTLNITFKEDKSRKHYINFFKGGKLISTDSDGRLFLLGTDINGRDNYSRLLYGGQISLTIGFLALFVSFPLGLMYGGISGYFGGKTDLIMMRLAEAIMSIPSFYLLIILASILPSSMTSAQRFALIVVILALIGWAGFARVVRGMVLSIKNEDYVKSAKILGASDFRIIWKHILPQTSSYVIVAITLSVPSYILAESGLSFLGLGIQQPDASWGNMLKEAQEFTNIISRPWLLAPGGLIFIAVLSFNLLGDTIRDYLDPKGKLS
ncbi:ABC transporter permease [bacterium]|nr:ABC transporter permease [bacterium]